MAINELMPELPEESLPNVKDLLSGHHYLIVFDPNLIDRREMERRVGPDLEKWGIKALIVPVNLAFHDPLKLYKLTKDEVSE